jgi:hypothetical protein
VSGPGILTEVLDEVLETLGAEAEAMAKARAAFDERRGPVFQDEDGWESRTRMFLEWYAVERPDGLTGRSPVAIAAAHEPDPRRRAAFEAWRRSYRCLAEIVRLGDGRVEILDLLGGARIAVDERRGLPGVELGDIAELRILAFEDQIRFGGAFLWHPAGIRGALVARIEALTAEGKSREEILDIASSLAVRSGRYKHVPAAKVYGD